MGFSAGGSKDGPKSTLNVTPLVDVVLVLLVIFMVTMPVMMRNLEVEIPPEPDDHPVVATQVIIKAMVDGTIEISDGVNKEVIQRTQLAKELRNRLASVSSDKRVFVDFDDHVPWGQVVSIMDTAKGIGRVTQEGKGSVREVVKTALMTRPAVLSH